MTAAYRRKMAAAAAALQLGYTLYQVCRTFAEAIIRSTIFSL